MANKKTKTHSSGKQKMTRAQMEAREQAAQARAKRAAEEKARAERGKKIFTVVVCVILVLALGIPTVALSVLNLG